jgi:hypothetical protein
MEHRSEAIWFVELFESYIMFDRLHPCIDKWAGILCAAPASARARATGPAERLRKAIVVDRAFS